MVASLYARLWKHFLAHAPVRDWLFHPVKSATSNTTSTIIRSTINETITLSCLERSLAFVCDFPIPNQLSSCKSSFALGELFIPVKIYGRYILGFIIAASPLHKVAASVACPTASNVIIRTVVVDPGVKDNDPLLLLDFAFLEDNSLVVAAKQLSPNNSDLPITGVVAFYSHYNNLARPYAVATFVENERLNIFPPIEEESPPESALIVAKRAAATQKARYTLSSANSEEALSSLIIATKRASSIRSAGQISVNMRVAGMAPDGRYLLTSTGSHREMHADFHVASDTQLTTLRQVAALTASFAHPNNTATATLLSSPSSSQPRSTSSLHHHQQQQRIDSSHTATSFALSPPHHHHHSTSTSMILPNNNTVNTHQSGDILAALADAERATDSEMCSPALIEQQSNRGVIVGSNTPEHNMDKFIENVSPVAASTIQQLPHPGALALPPSYTSIKSASVHQQQQLVPSPAHVYAFDYSPVSYSSPDTLAAVVAATDRAIDRAMFDKFFPASANSHHPSSSPPPTAPAPTQQQPMPAVHHPQPTPPLHPQPTQPLAPVQHSAPNQRTNLVRELPPRAPKRSRTGNSTCSECGKCFFKSGALARHIRYAHPAALRTVHTNASNTEAERLDCPRCDKTFSQQGSLNRHLRSIHEARKLHCRYCTLAFGQAFDLKRHQRRKHPGRATAVPREALPAVVLRGRARAISTDQSSSH